MSLKDMKYRPNPNNQGWVTCRDRLLETIAKWQKKPRAEASIECPAAPRYTAGFASPADRSVSVTFSAAKHVNRTVTIDRFSRPVDNLWALAIGLDAIRLNELRGLDDVARQVYKELPAPRRRDPWEVLGLRSDADPETIEAVFRSKAKRLHPDHGGDAAAFQELKEAYDELRSR